MQTQLEQLQPANGRWSNPDHYSDYASEFEADSSDLLGFSLALNHDAALTAFGWVSLELWKSTE